MKRVLTGALIALGACNVQPSGGPAGETAAINEFGNETSGGFPADRFRVEDCDEDMSLEPPFRVSEDGWGGLAIRAPLSLLDDPQETRTLVDGPSDQDRLAFHALGRRGIGLREEIAGGNARLGVGPAPTMDEFRSRANRRSPLDGYYVGMFAADRQAAIRCHGHGLPNPWCEAEVGTDSQMRYVAIFPQSAAHRLQDIVSIGDRLFAEVLSRCPTTPARGGR